MTDIDVEKQTFCTTRPLTPPPLGCFLTKQTLGTDAGLHQGQQLPLDVGLQRARKGQRPPSPQGPVRALSEIPSGGRMTVPEGTFPPGPPLCPAISTKNLSFLRAPAPPRLCDCISELTVICSPTSSGGLLCHRQDTNLGDSHWPPIQALLFTGCTIMGKPQFLHP